MGSSTRSVTKSQRIPRFTFIDQLGIIGGNLGLFTGMSILSMIEIAFWITRIVFPVCSV